MPDVTDADDAIEREAVFIAASVAEAKFVEDLLETEEIEYEVRPEVFARMPLSGACFQGLLFEVLSGQAEYCRALIRRAGLARGLVFSGEAPEAHR